MENLYPSKRRNRFGVGSQMKFTFVCLFLLVLIPNGINAQEVHPSGVGVCTQVVRKIETFTISYIQSSLVSFRGVCSWLDIQGCDQYKIVFTPAYKKAFRTVYQSVFTCCRGYTPQGRKCIPDSNPGGTDLPTVPPKRPGSRPRPPRPNPRPPSKPGGSRPSNPSGPNPGGGWGDLDVPGGSAAGGHPSNARPGEGEDGEKGDNGQPTTTAKPTAKSGAEREEGSKPSTEDATSTLRLLMVIGILLSVIGISVACSLCMMCWNHTKRDRRSAKSYAYVSKGKDDSNVTISTISRGYSVESFQSVSSASEASVCGTMSSDNPYKGIDLLDEGDSGIGKGSICGDESSSLMSDGSGSLEKNSKPPKYGYKRSGLAQRLTNTAGCYTVNYFGIKSKKQDRERLTTPSKEPWDDIRTIGIKKEKGTLYHTLEPEIFEEEDCSDDVSCDSGTGSDKPKAYAYAKVNLDHNTGMFYGSDPRYGVFPLQAWERPGSSTEYGSLASSTMNLHTNNGYDRLDRNCGRHKQGETSSKPCRHRDIEQQLFKLKPPPVSPKPSSKHTSPTYHAVCLDNRLTPPPSERSSFGMQSDTSSYSGMGGGSNGNVSTTSDMTLTPPATPQCGLLKVNQEFKRHLGGSLGDVSVRSEGSQLYSNTKPSYSKFAGGSWNDVSTLERNKKPDYSTVTTPPYSTIAQNTVSELSKKFNSIATPAIFVQDSNVSNVTKFEPPYTTVMRASSTSDVSTVSDDGKLVLPHHFTTNNDLYNTLSSGSISDVSITSEDRYINSSIRNTNEFSDIDLSTPRNTKDFSDIELVNLSTDSLKMDTRYSFTSVSSSGYTYS